MDFEEHARQVPFEKEGWTKEELEVFYRLKTPGDIQLFLDNELEYFGEPEGAWSPRMTLRSRRAHCFGGALFAAAALRRLGYPPIIFHLWADPKDDDDHALCLFQSPHPYPHLHPHPELLWPEGTTEKDKQDISTLPRYWGAIAKSNFSTLKFREPVYANVRELAMSYFDGYFTMDGLKTMRTYSDPIPLDMFVVPYREKTQEMHKIKGAKYKANNLANWMFDEESMEDIDYELMNCQHYQAIDPLRAKSFRLEKATPSVVKCMTFFTKPEHAHHTKS